MKYLRSSYRITLAIPLMLYAVIILLLFVGPDPTRRTVGDWRWINHWMRLLCKLLGIHTTVHGQPSTAPTLYVSNHISWHDIIILQSSLNAGFISKSEVRAWPLIGWMAYRGSTLFIHRGTHDAFFRIKNDVTERLNNKQNVLFFPEGTTSDGRHILKFKPRLFEPALLSKSQIQAIALEYNAAQLSKAGLAFNDNKTFISHILHTVGEKRIDVNIYFCEPISTDNTDTKELASKTQAQVERVFKSQQ